jgi:hypothetical protein
MGGQIFVSERVTRSMREHSGFKSADGSVDVEGISKAGNRESSFRVGALSERNFSGEEAWR